MLGKWWVGEALTGKIQKFVKVPESDSMGRKEKYIS